MGCAASLPATPAAPMDKGSLEAVKSGDVQEGALRSTGSQDFSHQPSERSTKASTRSSGADLSGLVLSHVQSHMSMVDEDDALTASNFNQETGAPDMGNGPLRMNLRNEEQWFQNTCGGNPQDFPRLAREFTRRRRRPQASTADGSQLPLWCSESGESSPGSTRRFSTPVLAEARFDEPSSLQTEAEMWRLWSAKDLPLTSRRAEGDQLSQLEGRDSKALDCSAQEFASLTSTCLPQAEHETILEDEDAEAQSCSFRRSHVPRVEDSVSCSALVEQIRGALHKALADDNVEEVVVPFAAQCGSDVLIMLDWDDTVLPTTWLASRPWFRAWLNKQACPELAHQLIDAQDLKALQNIDLAACEFLEEIHRWGQVVCITLAQRPWVQQSMKAFLPRLADRWEEFGIPVHYAVEEYARKNRWGSWCQKSSGPSLLESTVLEMNLRATQKFKVMNRLLRHFYRSKDYCNAISIGDGLAERNGLKEIAWCDCLMEVSSEKHLQAKTIQMLEDPTCVQLATELKVLKTWLPCVIRCNEDLDAVLG